MGDPVFSALMKDLPKAQCHFQHAGDLDSYRRFLRELDIGAMPADAEPLQPRAIGCEVHRTGPSGVVPLCPDLPPYGATARQVSPALLYSPDRGFEVELTALIQKSEQLTDLGPRSCAMGAHVCKKGRPTDTDSFCLTVEPAPRTGRGTGTRTAGGIGTTTGTRTGITTGKKLGQTGHRPGPRQPTRMFPSCVSRLRTGGPRR